MFADLQKTQKKKAKISLILQSAETNIDFHLSALAGINCLFREGTRTTSQKSLLLSPFEKASDNPERIMILQFIIQNYIIDHTKIVAQLAENRTKPKAKSKWATKMEEIQATQKRVQDMQKKGK